MKRARPPVLAESKSVFPPLLVVIVELAAVLELEKSVNPPPLVVMLALPAVLVSKKFVNPLPAVLAFKKFVVPPELLVIVVIPEVLALKTSKMLLLNTAPTIEPVAPTVPICRVPPLIVVPPV